MLTIKLWKYIYMKLFNTPLDYFIGVIGSLFTIPLDLILFPFEIIGFILYKILERWGLYVLSM